MLASLCLMWRGNVKMTLTFFSPAIENVINYVWLYALKSMALGGEG